MKTAKEKAEELVMTFLRLQEEGSSNWFHKELAKKCALICVREIIESIDWHEFETPNKEIEYWEEVRIEIQKS